MISDTDAPTRGEGAMAGVKRIVKRDAAGATAAAGSIKDGDGAKGGGASVKGAKGQMMYLTDETREQLKAHAERTGLTLTAIGEAALQQYLAGAAAASVGEVAAPAIEDAVGRRLGEALPAALHPLHDELRALRDALAATRVEVAMGRLQIFAQLASAYGLAYAQETEGYAERQAVGAVARGEIGHLHSEVAS